MSAVPLPDSTSTSAVQDAPKLGILVTRKKHARGPIKIALPVQPPPGRRAGEVARFFHWKPVVASVVVMLLIVSSAALAVRGSRAERPTKVLRNMITAAPVRPATTVGVASSRPMAASLPRLAATKSAALPQPPMASVRPVFVRVEQARVPPAPAAEVPAGTCGTAIDFVADPLAAAQTAEAENKLLFVLHVSGDFDDPGFT